MDEERINEIIEDYREIIGAIANIKGEYDFEDMIYAACQQTLLIYALEKAYSAAEIEHEKLIKKEEQ